jgi:O-antigen ligase
MRRWAAFWASLLVAAIALGAWRTTEASQQAERRGIELATRETDMPEKLPLAGVNVELTQYEELEPELSEIHSLGFVWLRQPFLWSEIEPEQGVFEWGAYDRIVEAVDAFEGDLRLVALLDSSPSWARHADAPEHPYAPPRSPAEFGAFVQAVAERYGDRVDVYQIWDEPNIEEHWGNLNPRPALYVAMLDAAYAAIHENDNNAMVIAAALAPTTEDGPDNINDPVYLRAIYDLGGGEAFDAAAGKPYGFNNPPDDRTVDVGTLNFSRLILLREIMVEHGDADKPLWGSNFGWNALPEDWSGPPSIWGSVNQQQKYDYTQQAYNRAESEWPWVGGLVLQHWEPAAPSDDPIQGFAIAPYTQEWQGVIPVPQGLTTGVYPAVNSFATYEGDWEFSNLGADAGPDAEQNTIMVPFEGSEFALRVRRGNYLAYLSVIIDGEPANALPRNRDGEAFIALTSAMREPIIDLILAADGLDNGPHSAVITHRPELGDDQWPIVGFAVGTAPESNNIPGRIALVVLVLSLSTAFVIGLRLPWGNVRLPSSASLRNVADFLLGLFFSAVVMVGALLTWQDTLSAALRRDMPAIFVSIGTSALLYYAPSTWLALIGLILLGLTIFSRPWIGLLQVIFWSAFFTTNLDPFFRALALVDVVLSITVAATFARLLYNHARGERWERPRLHPLDICMLAFVVLGAVSLSWSDLFPEAVRQLRIMVIAPAVFYMLIRIQKPSERDLAFLIEALLFTGLMLSVIGLMTYASGENVVIAEGGTRRLTSVYGSPNALGLYLGRCIPFALAYLLVPVSPWRKILAAVAGGLMLLAVALSQSAGALLLGIPVGIAAVILGWRGKRAVPILAGMGAAGAAALIPLSALLPRLRQFTDLENSTSVIRLNLWRSSFQLIREHPFTGVGLDQFLYAYRSRYILPQAWEDPDLSHPHNVLLDYWVRLGILGVVIALAFQWYFWSQALKVYSAVREHSPLRFALLIGAIGAMANFLAHGLVDMAHFNINLSYVFALLLTLVIQIEE